MKIRVVSDLHLDVNKMFPFSFEDKDLFTVICGDTSGSPDLTTKWIKENVKRGILVEGNHLVYNWEEASIEQLRTKLHNTFPIKGDVSFLEGADGGCCAKKVGGVLFLGSCLYSDMRWSNDGVAKEENIDVNKNVSYRLMNDFGWGLTERRKVRGIDNDSYFAPMRPDDYIFWFNNTLEAFDKALTENEKKRNPSPCFVVTHFAPSGKCIPAKYKYSEVNCAYVSDLERFIEKHTSIKCWAYGHIHAGMRTKYVRKDGSEVLLLNNSRGYCAHGESRGFDKDMIVDTETWEVFSEEFD